MYKTLMALMFSIPIVFATIGTTTVHAEPASATTIIAQAKLNSKTQLFPELEGTQLTPEQQSQLAALSEKTMSQIKSVLTPQQQSQFNASLNQGSGMQNALSSVGLSMRQKRQLRSQLQNTKSQLTQILTPEQQQQLSNKAQTIQNQKR